LGYYSKKNQITK